MQNQMEKTTKTIQSAEKAMTLMEILARQAEPMRLSDCARDAGINKTTALRLLTTLQKMGYVGQDINNSRYFLTMKIFALSRQVGVNLELKDVAAPFLRRLYQVFEESINLSIEHDGQVLYIDVVNSNPQMLTTMQRIGNTAFMHCTGSGKLMMLNYDDTQLKNLLSARGLPRLTDNTIDTVESLQKELDNTRSRGYAVDDQECTSGVRCFAAPVYDYTGRIVAGISVSGPASRMTNDVIDPKLPVLLDAAREISVRLGYDPGQKK